MLVDAYASWGVVMLVLNNILTFWEHALNACRCLCILGCGYARSE